MTITRYTISSLVLFVGVGCGMGSGEDLGAGGGGSGGGGTGGGGGSGGGGGYGETPPTDPIGATPGGAQDIGYARELIEAGEVPEGSDLTVEGLISEHDIPSKGPACDGLLCLRPALGRAPSLESGEREYWIHLGLASGLEDFERPPLDLVVAIDKSSAMAIDMEETNEAVTRLVDQLGPDDRLAVIAFDSEVTTVKRFGAIEDDASLKEDIRGIEASGGYDIALGTEAAYEILYDQTEEQSDRLRRVVMLSCGYPSLSSDLDDPYSERVLQGGHDRIGLSFYGVLLGYHDQLADLTGEAWGGRYGYLESLDKVEQVFDEEFDFGVTPLAYELEFAMNIGDRFELGGLYGVPGGDDDAKEQGFEVATVFPSSRGGAMAARLRPAEGEDGDGEKLISDVSLSYLPEPAIGAGEAAQEQSETITRPDGIGEDEDHYESRGVRKLVALVNMAERVKTAGDAYHAGEVEEAADVVRELRDYLEAEADALDDDDLRDEVELVQTLLDTIE